MKLNRVEKLTTTSILVVVILVMSLLASQWLSRSSFLVPPNNDGNEHEAPEEGFPPNDDEKNGEEPESPGENLTSYSPPLGSNIFGEVLGTDLGMIGRISIDGIGPFAFDPLQIDTKRPDIFAIGHFSVFDTIAYLDSTGKINAEYHLEESLNTYVIDSINGERNWWYEVYYDGGAPEPNAFRMDHYPVKDKMHIRVFQVSPSELEKIHSGFSDQIARRRKTDDFIIPRVTINGWSHSLNFQNVSVEAHNLRYDVFRPGIITAVDVILSLADQGKLSFDLRWYEAIGSSEIKNYYVDRIDEYEAYGRCGFVYECGERALGRKNHIHLPSDIRVINSPEYMSWFWICI